MHRAPAPASISTIGWADDDAPAAAADRTRAALTCDASATFLVDGADQAAFLRLWHEVAPASKRLNDTIQLAQGPHAHRAEA